MILKHDLHIHTHNSCDSACAQIADIVREEQALGIETFGISDHLHTRFNLPDVEAARKEFLEFGPVPGVHFGIEVSCATQWECDKIARRDYASCFTYNLKGYPFQTMTPIDGIMYGGPAGGPLCLDLTQEDIDRLGIEYVIGGVHKPNYTEQQPGPMIDDYFQQSCFLIQHPLVDILAHPWNGLVFWSGYFIVTRDPQDLDPSVFSLIPQEYWDEMGRLLLQHDKRAEINGGLLNPSWSAPLALCMEQFARWREKGVRFTYGCDLHAKHLSPENFAKMNSLLKEYGFTEQDFVLPQFRLNWETDIPLNTQL